MKKVGKTNRPLRFDLNQISYDYTVEVTNIFKGFDLIDRVHEELWPEVHDLVMGRKAWCAAVLGVTKNWTQLSKKAFLRFQCKEIEENNRMGKTRDLFKKIRNTKGAFHAKMGLIKDRNGMDLTEAEDKKMWQEYTEKLYKKDLHDPDNHDGVITDLEPDILECEVKWALESTTTNKASGGDGIPVELFKS